MELSGQYRWPTPHRKKALPLVRSRHQQALCWCSLRGGPHGARERCHCCRCGLHQRRQKSCHHRQKSCHRPTMPHKDDIKVEVEVDKGAPGPSMAPPAPVPVP